MKLEDTPAVKPGSFMETQQTARTGFFLKITIPLLILSFLGWAIARNWSPIQERVASANYSFLVLSLLLLILGHAGGAYLWFKILARGTKLNYKEAFRVFIVSNFGRFIPGVILHYVARVYLARKIGISTKEGILSVFLEAYYTLGGAILISLFALPLIFKIFNIPWQLFILVLLLVGLLIAILPSKVFRYAKKIPYLGKRIPPYPHQETFGTHTFFLIWSASLFLLNGVSFFLIALAFTNTVLSDLLVLSGLFAAAWVVGFLTPVAPGGLGVSDLSFAFLLTTFYDFPLAAFLTIVFRFGFLLSEGIIFLFIIRISGWDIISGRGQKE
ncbi:MAG: lysylphosphatidylglycerol synthase domain-containing protein [bacterium]|nr:lysylphosphatidylglycerol synthase domain-containing protein [bacterium]